MKQQEHRHGCGTENRQHRHGQSPDAEQTENQCTREKPKQQARVYFTCGDPQQREDRRLPVPRLRHGRLQPQNGAADFLFHSIVHSKSSHSSFESVFLAARSRDLTVGSGVFVIRAISFAVNWWK